MTTPVLPDTTAKLGPGTLKIGAIGAEIDVSCLLNNAKIEPSKDQGTSTTKLCGAVRPGTVTYTYELTGNIDIDVANNAGLFALSYSAPGSEQDFTFTPSTEAGTTATGKLILDPLTFGAGAYGDDLTSDIKFALVGAPTFTWTP